VKFSNGRHFGTARIASRPFDVLSTKWCPAAFRYVASSEQYMPFVAFKHQDSYKQAFDILAGARPISSRLHYRILITGSGRGVWPSRCVARRIFSHRHSNSWGAMARMARMLDSNALRKCEEARRSLPLSISNNFATKRKYVDNCIRGACKVIGILKRESFLTVQGHLPRCSAIHPSSPHR